MNKRDKAESIAMRIVEQQWKNCSDTFEAPDGVTDLSNEHLYALLEKNGYWYDGLSGKWEN